MVAKIIAPSYPKSTFADGNSVLDRRIPIIPSETDVPFNKQLQNDVECDAAYPLLDQKRHDCLVRQSRYGGTAIVLENDC